MFFKLLFSPAAQFGGLLSGMMFMLPLGLAMGSTLLIILACLNGALACHFYRVWLLTQPQETHKDDED